MSTRSLIAIVNKFDGKMKFLEYLELVIKFSDLMDSKGIK